MAGSITLTESEAKARLLKVGAKLEKTKPGGTKVYSHTSGAKWVLVEPLGGGKVKLTESGSCPC